MLEDGAFQGDTHVFNSTACPYIFAAVVAVPGTPGLAVVAPSDTIKSTSGKIL